MISKVRTALIIILGAASMTFASPVQPQFDETELVSKLCGRLEQVDSIPDKVIPGKYSEKSHPIKNAKLIAYQRQSNSECCATSPVAAEIRSDKSGNFEFKGLQKGYYWLVAKVELQDYQIAIRIAQLKDKQPVCSQMSFVIDPFGDFTLRVRAPGR